jgi:hypothetical protein
LLITESVEALVVIVDPLVTIASLMVPIFLSNSLKFQSQFHSFCYQLLFSCSIRYPFCWKHWKIRFFFN